jgi:hypothetical protein
MIVRLTYDIEGKTYDIIVGKPETYDVATTYDIIGLSLRSNLNVVTVRNMIARATRMSFVRCSFKLSRRRSNLRCRRSGRTISAQVTYDVACHGGKNPDGMLT